MQFIFYIAVNMPNYEFIPDTDVIDKCKETWLCLLLSSNSEHHSA